MAPKGCRPPSPSSEGVFVVPAQMSQAGEMARDAPVGRTCTECRPNMRECISEVSKPVSEQDGPPCVCSASLLAGLPQQRAGLGRVEAGSRGRQERGR